MFQSGRKRFAICFSGQPRTWRRCIDTWHNVILHNSSDIDVDVFCHVWNFNTISSATGEINPEPEIVSQDEINELLRFLKPKKVLVETEKTFTPHNPSQALIVPSWLSQYYGIMRAARLKKEYEIENDFMYHSVVRARYDAVYESQISGSYLETRPNTMHGFHFGWDQTTNRGRMGDICWIADSATYDIISDYYLNLEFIDQKWFNDPPPEQVFFHYLKKNNINIESNRWTIKLMRPSQDHSFSKNKDGYETW